MECLSLLNHFNPTRLIVRCGITTAVYWQSFARTHETRQRFHTFRRFVRRNHRGYHPGMDTVSIRVACQSTIDNWWFIFKEAWFIDMDLPLLFILKQETTESMSKEPRIVKIWWIRTLLWSTKKLSLHESELMQHHCFRSCFRCTIATLNQPHNWREHNSPDKTAVENPLWQTNSWKCKIHPLKNSFTAGFPVENRILNFQVSQGISLWISHQPISIHPPRIGRWAKHLAMFPSKDPQLLRFLEPCRAGGWSGAHGFLAEKV